MILFLLLLGTSFSASAQMTDLMGNLILDSEMTVQATKGYNVANLQVKKNNLEQELQMKNIEIQTLMTANPQNVSRETFSVLNYPATAQIEQSGGYSITLKQVEKGLCQSLGNQFAGAKKIKISPQNNCSDKNIITFYY